MRIISIIEDQEVINKILLHLGLWQTAQRPPPKPKSLELQIDYSDTQLPSQERYPDGSLSLPSFFNDNGLTSGFS